MKKRWYKKSGLKGLMVCLTIVALVVGCVCGGASILLMSKGIRPLDSRKYVDSESLHIYGCPADECPCS